MGKQYWFLAVFEALRPVEVQQGYEVTINQVVTQKWSRTGTVNVSPGQPTEDVVMQVVETCRTDATLPDDTLLTDIKLMPNTLIPRR